MALLSLSIEVLVYSGSLCSGVLPQNPEQNSHMLFFVFQFTAERWPFHHVGWGCRLGHPYLLISRPGKRSRPDWGGFETDPSSNKLGDAKLRRRKSHLSPLLPLVLAMKPEQRKELKTTRVQEFCLRPRLQEKRP